MLPRPSYNYSTTTDTEDEQKVMKAAKRRRMVIRLTKVTHCKREIFYTLGLNFCSIG